ncbi:MAG: DedA family protein [Deltaproteobacteria bacterium]|jgi:membrane protein DedA with SNARE-associated domain|nr:DedA family protein [Deltaproteobacteria bacterium]
MDLESVRLLLEQWGYLIIIGWTFIEGETVVIIAGLLAQQEILKLNPWLIALSALTGSFCSDQLMFFLGKFKGPAIFNRFPRLAKNTEKARNLMLKYENALILCFRFIYGVRNITPILLGLSGVSYKKFFALNLTGACIWALSFTFGGHYFGELLEQVSATYPNAKYVILGGLALIVTLVFIIRRVRNRANAK